MISFAKVNASINALENSKRAFDDKINMLNSVKSKIYSAWHTGADRDKTCQAIDKIIDRCRQGKTLCEYAISDARQALQAAQQEKTRREKEARAQAEREKKLADDRRREQLERMRRS